MCAGMSEKIIPGLFFSTHASFPSRTHINRRNFFFFLFFFECFKCTTLFSGDGKDSSGNSVLSQTDSLLEIVENWSVPFDIKQHVIDDEVVPLDS